MKRKIQAKMKRQGMPSNDGAVQRIAVSIVDNSETLAETPVQTPEATMAASPPAAVKPVTEARKDTSHAEQTTGLESSSSDTPTTDVGEDDEEARLLAELDAERQ